MNIFQEMRRNGHFETLFPYLFCSAPVLDYKRERIVTRDNDFLDLDWVQKKSERLVILSHGLESSSSAKYVRSTGFNCLEDGLDVLAWNYRGCSGEMNKSIKYYHSGATDDLDDVIKHVVKNYPYTEIYLVGFSLGGNLVLKYMGENSSALHSNIKLAVAVSAPVCLKTSSHKLKKGFNKVYTRNFLTTLKRKVLAKEKKLLDSGFNLKKVKQAADLPQFDDCFTGPVHGFLNADDYYEKCSSKKFLKEILKPTLIINAKNDPFLSPECFPYEEVKNNKNIVFIAAERGGHVGFKNFIWEKSKGIETIITTFIKHSNPL